jgi:ATP-dependent RNA helicase HelY
VTGSRPDARVFATGYPFELDAFQRAGISALAEGRSTLVAAPTGAGKTVVAEFAVWHALRRGRKCFYTTPIKALSNQKYADLCLRHGAASVGLLTGDNVVNPEAPVVVMTTEVLRNMLYEGSSTLRGLGSVVLDEVHYLADRERGAVWEEVIIQLPAGVQLACLSATVSNAEEFGAWLRSVRQSCDVVITDWRPVPLDHHYAIDGKLLPVFKAGAKPGARPSTEALEAAKQARGGKPNPEILMLERRASSRDRVTRGGRRVSTGGRLRPPRRSDLVTDLRRRHWLPAIYFLFSRSGCDAAVSQLVADRMVLTTQPERLRIRETVAARTAGMAPDDLEVLGAAAWGEALERGVAAHHAGLVPVFKETVEELFVAGLVKVCFATETLALGINMPARTVVIERLEKWDGQRHALLTPGQFTQLTGRAGRRGLDERGHAVVAYQRDIDFPTVASLVGRRVEPLRSSFAPSYNMAVNLLRHRDRAEAERLLARSFGQFQADATVSDDEERIARNRAALEGYAGNLSSERGDFLEYWRLRRELSSLESERAADRRRSRGEAVEHAIGRLREGDVVTLPGGPKRDRAGSRRPDLAAIVERSQTRGGTPLASAVTEDRRLVRLGPREFDRPPETVGRIELPRRGHPRQPAWRKQVAAAVRGIDVPPVSARAEAPQAGDGAERVQALREQIRAHPVHSDPKLPEIEVWAHRHDELERDTGKLERRVRRRTGSLVREFDRIVGVLTSLGYLEGDAGAERPTPLGLVLAGIYSETDLVLTECLRSGVLDGLDPGDLAAVVSSFVYEARTKEPPEPRFPDRGVRDATRAVLALWTSVVAREDDAGLRPTRAPDPGFADQVWRWAEGADLDDALAYSETTAGDFVRGIKQVADLLRQIRDAAPAGTLTERAHEANKALVRGVVAHSAV